MQLNDSVIKWLYHMSIRETLVMYRAFVSLFVTLLVEFSISTNMKCLKSSREPNHFSLLRNCQRSTQPVVGLTNTNSPQECEEFTKSVKGLAFNYSPLKYRFYAFSMDAKPGNGTIFPRKSPGQHILDQPEEYYRCHALGCPEVGNLSTIVNDVRFDYYSLYTNPIPPSNTTCIPEVGLFQINSSPKNFSEAFEACIKESNGTLANVLSEGRTNGLAYILRTIGNDSEINKRTAFVGLNYTLPDQEFHSSEGESLECFAYRAWAPGYPKRHRNESCAAIKEDNSWITVECSSTLPFICEILSSSPTDENTDYCFMKTSSSDFLARLGISHIE